MKIKLALIVLLFSTFACTKVKNNYLVSFTDSSSVQELIGYKSKQGEIIIEPKYSQVSTDTLSTMAFVLLNSEWLAINQNGKVILKPFIYDNGPDYFEEGLFRFVENNKIGFANADGKKIIEAKFDFATPFSGGLSEYYLGGYKEYEKDGEHWYWKDSKEKGYLNKLGQRFKEIGELKNNQREAFTFENKRVLLNPKGEIIE